MRIGYFGSPEISAALLRRLLAQEYAKGLEQGEIIFVVSNPDRPKGRSSQLIPTPVSRTILELEEKQGSIKKIPALLQFEKLGDAQIKKIKEFQADLFVVFAYGKILPQKILDLPKLGAINLHASLLPELRGAAPVQTAILQGMTRTGWTVQYIKQAMDSGDVLAQSALEIGANETAGELLERMLPSGIELLLQSLKGLRSAQAKPQDETKSTYCKKLHAHKAQLHWNMLAEKIHNFVRAHNPAPLAWTLWENTRLKIHATRLLTAQELSAASKNELWRQAAAGSFGLSPLNNKELWVQCSDQAIAVCFLQPENKRKLSAQEFLNGYRSKDKLVILK